VLIDPPAWPAHGRLWSHLASDTSYAELHDFARTSGVPVRAFEGDHYDVPQDRYDDLVSAGALPVASRDLLRALQLSGLRLPKRKGERVLRTWPAGHWLPGAGPHRVDCVASPIGPPAASTIGGRLLAVRSGRIALVDDDLPPAAPGGPFVGYVRARFVGGPAAGYPWPRAHLAVRTSSGAGLEGALRARWVDLAGAERVAGQRYWWPLVGWLLRREQPLL
jgi:hypothetical protein